MEIPQIQIHEAKKKLEEKTSMFVDIRDPGSYRASAYSRRAASSRWQCSRIYAEHRQRDLGRRLLLSR